MNHEIGKQTVALYARVSTVDQSCDMQLEDLRRYASRFGRSYEYVEIGVSGAQRRRPQLDQLMKDAHKRLFDVVLVWKFDRFARSVGAVAQFERDLIAERVRAGIAHARAQGKRIGRPPAAVDTSEVTRLRSQGMSLRAVARMLDIPVSRVRRALSRQNLRESA